MLDLGNGTIYLNEAEPLPFGCPQCHHPVPFTTQQALECPTCHFKGERRVFNFVQWKFVPAS